LNNFRKGEEGKPLPGEEGTDGSLKLSGEEKGNRGVRLKIRAGKKKKEGSGSAAWDAAVQAKRVRCEEKARAIGPNSAKRRKEISGDRGGKKVQLSSGAKGGY